MNSEQAIKQLLASKQPFVCFLKGELGAGKTTFVRSYMQALGFTGVVKSPSYTLIELYDEQLVAHLDFYRMQVADAMLLAELGLPDLITSYQIFIEWPERLAPGLIQPDYTISITIDSDLSRVFYLT